ncbi:hypothetical protein [Bifidobacterium sp. ESL0745]|uniref:hypothetical protein n=1 Tax=Bifidobacterium sp. ESL0745 TaxID=2983226 RepID=UPI0023F66FAB|nr:hypothetical protein [Bifidobacterium sp. ESL0745]MDF7665727.1 hypothetical protein [Bifidobacterium sp. ESL0745]
MMAYLVQTPVEGYTGIVAGVAFRHGFGKTDGKPDGTLDYFRRHGYTITEEKDSESQDSGTASPPAKAPEEVSAADPTPAEGTDDKESDDAKATAAKAKSTTKPTK